MLTIEKIKEALIAEGYENIHGNDTQIIVNNRGEIDEVVPGMFQMHSRIPGHGYIPGTDNLKELILLVKMHWTRYEPK